MSVASGSAAELTTSCLCFGLGHPSGPPDDHAAPTQYIVLSSPDFSPFSLSAGAPDPCRPPAPPRRPVRAREPGPESRTPTYGRGRAQKPKIMGFSRERNKFFCFFRVKWLWAVCVPAGPTLRRRDRPPHHLHGHPAGRTGGRVSAAAGGAPASNAFWERMRFSVCPQTTLSSASSSWADLLAPVGGQATHEQRARGRGARRRGPPRIDLDGNLLPRGHPTRTSPRRLSRHPCRG